MGDDEKQPSGTAQDPRPELLQLAATYASAVDQRDQAALLSVFVPDATLTVHRADRSDHMTGHGELSRITERIARYEKTFHMLGQGAYQVDGDTAQGEVYCVANHLKGGINTVMFIRYHDRYVRDEADGRWRISQRELAVDWVEQHPIDQVPKG